MSLLEKSLSKQYEQEVKPIKKLKKRDILYDVLQII